MKIEATFDYEKVLWQDGARQIAGIDEVGRGAWAGPVVAAAVIFPSMFEPHFKIFDSKLLLPHAREELAKKIRAVGKIGIGVVQVPTIDKIGIGNATQKAFKYAVKNLVVNCDRYLIDAFYIKNWPRDIQIALKSGDKYCASIAAASVVGKVYRDNLMKRLATRFPMYELHRHKGYGTKAHQQAIAHYKLSKIHRKSFNLSAYLNG
ncbi:MAG: ribonuclease HII [Candidatus Woykebacteria bacterium]